MIAIICAMSEERDAFLNMMTSFKVEYEKRVLYHEGKILDNRYYIGDINGVRVVLCRCGVGKVYAAIGTTLLIQRYQPDLVLNVGVAGALTNQLNVGDVVTATRVADWEVDIPKWERSFDSSKIAYKCDNKIIQLSEGYNDSIPTVFTGPIVSGDEFVRKKSQLKTIKKFFPDAVCVDMEGASIANSCYAFETPFAIIRSISDKTMVENNYDDHEYNLYEACDNLTKFVSRIINGY